MNGIVNLNTRVSELLNRMGVPDYTAGYSFLHTAIMSVYEQPDLLGSIIKCLYVVVANKHNDCGACGGRTGACTSGNPIIRRSCHAAEGTAYPALQTADIAGIHRNVIKIY